MEVGIEALGIALPRRFLELEDLAAARRVDPAKYTVGLGGRRIAIADPGEDAVALAATAARRVLAGVDAARIGMLAVGTESGVDHAKPVAAHVHGLLGLPRGVRTFDVKHACYGGTAAVMSACEWIASGAARGRAALVVCADVARYPSGSPAEPTQGAGAVALLVSDDPRALAIDLGASGVATRDVYDFWRPHGLREALVDGARSIECYLDALAAAHISWQEATGLTARDLERIVYHVPFPKMARKAHARIADDATFERQVAPSLSLPAEVGNIYTGSLWLALASLLDAEGAELAGRRIGLFSYGSGSCGEFFTGTVGADAAPSGIAAILAARERIDVAHYESIRAMPEDAPPPLAPRPGEFRLACVREARRIYARGPDRAEPLRNARAAVAC